MPSVVYGLWGIFFLAPKLQPRRAVGRRPALVHPVHRRRHRDDPQLLHRRAGPRDHDPADRQRDQPRGDGDRARRPQGGGARPRRDALGDDPHRRAALLPLGHRRRRDARPRPRDRRDDRRDDPDRRRAAARQPPVRPGLQPRGGDRQRVRRGAGPAPLGAVRRRARAVRADAARQRHRARCSSSARRAQRPPSGAAAAPTPARRAASPRRRRAHERAAAQPARAAGALRRQPGAPAQGPARARLDPRRHRDRADPARADRLLPAQQGPRLVELRASSRPTRPATRSSRTSSIGGIKSAILGTIEIVALASAIAIPIGIGVAVWLVEYGRDSWFAHARALLRRRAHGRARRSSSACSSTSC